MKIIQVENKSDWSEGAEFLQSWEYGEFLKVNGRKVKRVHLKKDGKVVQLQFVVNQLPFGIKFTYIPRVVIESGLEKQVFDYFKKEGFTFVRLEPVEEIKTFGYQTKKVMNRQPHHTWILNVEKTEDELLKEMHAKTRYNIKLAERKGVVIENKKDVEFYWQLNKITTERNNFKSHSKDFCKKLIEANFSYQINATYDGVPLASAILLCYKDVLIYFFGASSNEHRNLMAPYLMHWEIIKLAKSLGCKYYDFWGIASPGEEGQKDSSCYHKYCWKEGHPLSGVSRFKAGFGGELKSYPDAVEVVLNPFKYKIFKLKELLTRHKGVVGHPLK